MKLSADAYDTLEFVAEVYEGVGSGSTFRRNNDEEYAMPNCPIGMALFATETDDRVILGTYGSDNPINLELKKAGFDYAKSDEIVRNYKINVLGLSPNRNVNYHKARMPFQLWAEAYGIERGE